MVKIVIENLAQKEVLGNDLRTSVLKLLQLNYVDWMHACGGKGRCTTCKMVVLEGSDQLTALSEAELNYQKKGDLTEGERLACQATVVGYCRVRVPDEYKLPHMIYTD